MLRLAGFMLMRMIWGVKTKSRLMIWTPLPPNGVIMHQRKQRKKRGVRNE